MSRLTEAIGALESITDQVREAEGRNQVARDFGRALHRIAGFTGMSDEDSAVIIDALGDSLPEAVTLVESAGRLALLVGADDALADQGREVATKLRAVVESQMFDDDFPEQIAQARTLLSGWDEVAPKKPGSGGARRAAGSGKFRVNIHYAGKKVTSQSGDKLGPVLNSARYQALGSIGKTLDPVLTSTGAADWEKHPQGSSIRADIDKAVEDVTGAEGTMTSERGAWKVEVLTQVQVASAPATDAPATDQQEGSTEAA